MKTLSKRIKERYRTATELNQSVFRNEHGAIDLASIMVGIIVIGLIGGVIAATVFAVIPWTQDNAAKQQLDSIVQAENAYQGFSSSTTNPLPVGYTPDSFTDSPGLATAGLLEISPHYCVISTNGGKGYQGFSASGSGAVFTVTNSNSAPATFSGSLPSVRQGLTTSSLPPVNTTKRLRFGVSVQDGPLTNEVDNVATEAGEFPSIVSTYKDFTTPYNATEVQTIESEGAQPMITWEPWDASMGGTSQPNYSLASIYNGQHDAYIQSWINAIKSQNPSKPILIRFGQEMNGNWYPWGYGVNGNAAGTYDSTNHWATGDYAKAYRYIHDKFTSAGLDSSKVQWVFAPNNTASGGEDLWNFWPGASYVDYNAVDGFNWGTTGGPMTWQQPWDVFGGELWHLNNDSDIAGKPIIIAETASVQDESPNTQAQWTANLVNWLDTDPGNTNVVGFVYFNYNKMEGSTMTDWRFDSNSAGISAMKTALASRPN